MNKYSNLRENCKFSLHLNDDWQRILNITFISHKLHACWAVYLLTQFIDTQACCVLHFNIAVCQLRQVEFHLHMMSHSCHHNNKITRFVLLTFITAKHGTAPAVVKVTLQVNGRTDLSGSCPQKLPRQKSWNLKQLITSGKVPTC